MTVLGQTGETAAIDPATAPERGHQWNENGAAHRDPTVPAVDPLSPTTRTTTTATASHDDATPVDLESDVRHSRSESALAWFQRCHNHRRRHQRTLAAAHEEEQRVPPATPAAAAWAFFNASVLGGGTGVPFVDESLRRRRSSSLHNNMLLPAMELCDNGGKTGKTRTIVQLAAQFVVATRPSLFPPPISPSTLPPSHPQQHKLLLPRVILLDSCLDVTSLQLANTVSSLLIRRQPQDPTTTTNNVDIVAALEQDMESSLRRIHVAHVDDPREWVPVLEAIRCQLASCAAVSADSHQEKAATEDYFPTLLLWDGFLSEPGLTEGIQKEIARQLALLLQDCTVGLIYTTSSSSSAGHTSNSNNTFHVRSLQSSLATNSISSNRKEDAAAAAISGEGGPVAHTVRLALDESPDTGHGFVATLAQGNHHQIPYSLSAAGVLR